MSKFRHKHITRNREVKSCQRCVAGKRKCDKNKPNCGRCTRISTICSYSKTALLKAPTLEMNFSEDSFKSLRFVVEASNNKTTNNFHIVTNLTGELSVFISSSLFPFFNLSTASFDIFEVTHGNAGIHDTFDFSRLTTKKLNLRQLKDRLPSKEIGNYFISHFFNEIFPLIPIIDSADFLLKWRSYWEDPSSFADMNALILLFGVFFATCASIKLNSSFRGASDLPNLELEKLQIEYFECVDNIKYLLRTDICPSIPAISSLGLMYYVSSLNCYGLAAAVSTLHRYCQMAGLHRRTSNVSEMPLKEILYGYVTYLDSLVSIYHGIPPQVDPRVSEIIKISDDLPENVYILGFLGRFLSVRLCARVKMSLNKIRGSRKRDLRKMTNSLRKLQRDVNSINDKICYIQDVLEPVKLLLKAGNLLFLRRAAYFLAIMKITVESNNGAKAITIDGRNKGLLAQSLLLMNESFQLISQSIDSKQPCLWFVRNTYPIEPMLIVVSNLQRHPTESINFCDLDENVCYTRYPSIDYLSGDLREIILDKCCDALLQVECLWPPILRTTFQKVVAIKENLLSKRRWA